LSLQRLDHGFDFRPWQQWKALPWWKKLSWQAWVLPVFPLPFIPVQYRWNFDRVAMRLLGLYVGGHQIRNALAQSELSSIGT
jgi:hypothetical protein